MSRTRRQIPSSVPRIAFSEVLLLHDNIYNNTKLGDCWQFGRNEYLAPLDIAAGMFGSPVVRFWLDAEKRPIDANDTTHGGGRRITEKERLYIGAVGVFNEGTERSPIQIDFFHNPFSTKPVWPRYFPHPNY